MRILYQEPYMNYKPWVNAPLVCLLILASVTIFIYACYLSSKQKPFIGSCIFAASFIFTISWGTIVGTTIQTGNVYYVSVEPGHILEEYINNYELIEQKGDIYMIVAENINERNKTGSELKKKAIDDSQLELPENN